MANVRPGRVEDVVGDDAVVARVEAGRDRVVIGKCFRREARDQIACVHAAGRQAPEVWRRHLRGVVPAEAVEGDQDDRRLEVSERIPLRGGNRRADGEGEKRDTDSTHLRDCTGVRPPQRIVPGSDPLHKPYQG